MDVDWPTAFNQQLDRYETQAGQSSRDRQILDLLTFMFRQLRELSGEPAGDTATIKQVRQSRQHRLWRVSHPYREGIALRLICWFPPGQSTVVVALFTGEKAAMGDVFYDSVGTRADQLIDQWIRETAPEETS